MPLRIGELAKRSGLTVRALRHYDAIGLLSPSARSQGRSPSNRDSRSVIVFSVLAQGHDTTCRAKVIGFLPVSATGSCP